MKDLLPVLVIEDDEFLLTFLKAALHQGGLMAVGASSGGEALGLLERGEFAGIISDLRLTGMIDGAKVFDWVRQHRPQLSRRFLFVTGDIHAAYAAEVRLRTGAQFLEKPFRVAQMIELIKKILSQGETAYA